MTDANKFEIQLFKYDELTKEDPFLGLGLNWAVTGGDWLAKGGQNDSNILAKSLLWLSQQNNNNIFKPKVKYCHAESSQC